MKIYSDTAYFFSKYIVSTYTPDIINEIDSYMYMDDREKRRMVQDHNKSLINKTTELYNTWLKKEQKTSKKIKSNELIKALEQAEKDIKGYRGGIITQYDKYYMFDCTYSPSGPSQTSPPPLRMSPRHLAQRYTPELTKDRLKWMRQLQQEYQDIRQLPDPPLYIF